MTHATLRGCRAKYDGNLVAISRSIGDSLSVQEPASLDEIRRRLYAARAERVERLRDRSQREAAVLQVPDQLEPAQVLRLASSLAEPLSRQLG